LSGFRFIQTLLHQTLAQQQLRFKDISTPNLASPFYLSSNPFTAQLEV